MAYIFVQTCQYLLDAAHKAFLLFHLIRINNENNNIQSCRPVEFFFNLYNSNKVEILKINIFESLVSDSPSNSDELSCYVTTLLISLSCATAYFQSLV